MNGCRRVMLGKCLCRVRETKNMHGWLEAIAAKKYNENESMTYENRCNNRKHEDIKRS